MPWSLVWSIAAVLHVTQGIWLSRGAAVPGDLGDGRFNQLVLEHGYQSLRGIYEWSSPGQFFPARNTLGFSDTHAGTLPFYALLRVLGFSMARAWQAWFVIIAALNATAAWQLFRAFGISMWLRGPLVFAAVSSVTMVWITGTHMQMLPIFPGVCAWAELVWWHRDRRPHRLVAASGWAAWQFPAGPYLAFFWVVITLIAGTIHLCFRPGFLAPNASRTRPQSTVFQWLSSSAIAFAGWALMMAAALVYLKARDAGVSRSMAEIWEFSPDWKSWVTAPPVHAFYPAGWPGGQSDLVEHAWFAGFLRLLVLPIAGWLGWKNRRSPDGAWMLALSGGVFGTVLFFTKWGETGPGLWIALASRFDALHAFRSTGRVATLLGVVEIAAAGLVLSRCESVFNFRWRILPALAATAIACEGLATRQPTTLLAVARARSDATIAAWREAGGRPVLAYAYGYTTQSDPLLNLDAWSAALRLKKKTLNGYTGGIPGSHQRFIWNPTVENAEALIASTGLPRDQFSIVESLSPEANTAFGITKLNQRSLVGLEGFELQPFAWKLFSPLERYVVNGLTMYQFTPAAELKFHLPDHVSRISITQAMRAGSYSDGGNSDGVGITWLVRSAASVDAVVWHEHFNPRDNAADRGVVTRNFAVPTGADRTLILRVDTGPEKNFAWDWPLFGKLEVR